MKLSALALTLLLSTNIAFTSELCTNSVEAICKNYREDNKHKNDHLRELSKKINDAAAPKIKERTEKELKQIPKYRLIKRKLTQIKIMLQEISSSATNFFPEVNNFYADLKNQEELKSYVKTAIETTSFSDKIKKDMLKTIDEVQFISFENFITLLQTNESLTNFFNTGVCGANGLMDNAAAFEDLSNTKYIIICPGLAIKAQLETQKTNSYEDVVMAIAHELGHHIDYRKYGSQYGNYLRCIANNHASTLKMTKQTKKLCKNRSKDLCDLENTTAHANELISDVWGLKALNAYRKKYNFSISDTETLMKSNLGMLCGTPDEGIHPSGDFRTGIHFQANEDVKEALSCQESNVTTCSF